MNDKIILDADWYYYQDQKLNCPFCGSGLVLLREERDAEHDWTTLYYHCQDATEWFCSRTELVARFSITRVHTDGKPYLLMSWIELEIDNKES
jgi:hypothetical protein